MNTYMKDTDIWRAGTCIYCKRGDGHLIRIQSSQPDKVLTVIDALKKGQGAEAVQTDGISPEDFSSIAQFLMRQGLAVSTPKPRTGAFHIGFFGSDTLMRICSERFSKNSGAPAADSSGPVWKKVSTESDLEGLQLLLVFCNLFDRYETIRDLSDEAYRRGLPLLHASLTPTSFTIGPLSVPRLDTPSLHCYMKRRSVNLKDPAIYSDFIFATDRQAIFLSDPSELPYLDAGLNILGNELQTLVDHDCALSLHLMGKSHTFDFAQFTYEESTVLKDPLSPLFSSNAPYTPFNN